MLLEFKLVIFFLFNINLILYFFNDSWLIVFLIKCKYLFFKIFLLKLLGVSKIKLLRCIFNGMMFLKKVLKFIEVKLFFINCRVLFYKEIIFII